MPPHKDLLISPSGQGKQISFAPALKEQGLLLKRAARQGYYYPMLAIKHLTALSTGLSGKQNVFIPNINNFKAKSFQQFSVFVPGIQATVERRSNDTLIVTQLFLDPNESYLAIERGSTIKPGVYTANKLSSKWEVKYKNNGRITPENARKVVIADTNHKKPNDAAVEISNKLSALFGKQAGLSKSFDLFYTPAGAKLGGMFNYNPTIINQGYAYAGLLADAMEQAKNQSEVIWASEKSGSVILTQALQTLALKNVSFADKNHIVSMSQPTTNPNVTLLAAKQIGMVADKELAYGDGHIRASVSSLLTNASRAKDKNDDYNWQDYANGLANGSTAAAAGVGALALLASTVINAPTVTTVGTVAGSVGAIQFAFKSLKKRFN